MKTPAGYVAQSQLIAALPTLAVDCALSPRGELVVTTHTGKPDWGTGPGGFGRIFKISRASNAASSPVFAYAASSTETRVEFDRPLQPEQWKNLAKQSVVESGRYVSAGDRFETFRPGYKVVQMQQAEKRRTNTVLTAATQPGSRLDFEYPPETVTVVFTGSAPLRLATGGTAKAERVNERTSRLTMKAPKPDDWIPFDVTLETRADSGACAQSRSPRLHD